MQRPYSPAVVLSGHSRHIPKRKILFLSLFPGFSVSDDLFCKTFFIPLEVVQSNRIIGRNLFFNSRQNTKSLDLDHVFISDPPGLY